MARAKRLLLVDDDALLRDTLIEQFDLHEEFAIDSAATASDAIARVKDEASIDLVILDVGLPDMDGRDACRIMRKNGFKSPILMLTGADSEADTILGLDAGANDYITKPFKFSVLLARLRAHLRSHEQSEDAIFRIGPYEFKPAVKMLMTVDGKRIKLTEKETSILKYLYRAGGKVVTREILLDEVWGYNSGVTTHTLETHVYRLRQKIEPDPKQMSLLLTDGGGYKLASNA